LLTLAERCDRFVLGGLKQFPAGDLEGGPEPADRVLERGDVVVDQGSRRM
jgi:hypothetical protein